MKFCIIIFFILSNCNILASNEITTSIVNQIGENLIDKDKSIYKKTAESPRKSKKNNLQCSTKETSDFQKNSDKDKLKDNFKNDILQELRRKNVSEKDTLYISILLNFFFAVIGVIIGYIFKSIAAFYENKKRAYSETISALARLMHNTTSNISSDEYSKIICSLWLFGSRKICIKVDRVLGFMHKPNRDKRNRYLKIMKLLKEITLDMRKDINPFCKILLKKTKCNLELDDFNHLYTNLGEKS